MNVEDLAHESVGDGTPALREDLVAFLAHMQSELTEITELDLLSAAAAFADGWRWAEARFSHD